MKSMNIESWVDVRRLTPGRRSFCASRMKASPRAAELPGVVAACEAVIGAEALQLELQRRYESGKGVSGAVWSPELVSLDIVLDRLVVELRDLLAAVAARAGSARGEAGKALLDEFFAQGVPYYTQVAFEDQTARVGELVKRLAERAALVQAATADEVVAELTAVHTKFDALVATTESAKRVEYAEVKALDLANQRRFLDLIVVVLGQTATLSDEGLRTALRTALLGVVAQQDDDVAALIRAKRRVKDVDPTTGDVVDPGTTD